MEKGHYRNEHLVPIVADWEYTYKKETYSDHIDAKSISRMFLMFVKENSRLLCPFDWDGTFSFMADKAGVKWTSVEVPYAYKCNRPLLFGNISKDHYELRLETFARPKSERKTKEETEVFQNWLENEDDVQAKVSAIISVLHKSHENELTISKTDMIKLLEYVRKQQNTFQVIKEQSDKKDEIISEQNTTIVKLKGESDKKDTIISEQKELLAKSKDEINNLKASIELIQRNLGAVSINEAIERIHELVESTAQPFSINDCLSEAQNWVRPNWGKLESESKQFIPTGLTLYNQLKLYQFAVL